MANIGYYYCSIKTMKSILENHSLRFSDPLKMNDGRELTWFFDELFNYEDYHFRYPAELNSNAFSKISSPTDLINKGQKALYCLCLSKDGDDIGLWRSYAKDASGVAIGLDIDKIIGDGEGFISQFDIEYTKKLTPDQKELVQKNIIATETIYGGFVDNKTIPPAGMSFLYINGLLQESIKYKSPDYAGEKEVRVLYDISPDVNSEIRAALIKTRKDKKFSKIDYHNQEFKNSPIVSITIGPTCNHKEDYFRRKIKEYGYTDGIVITKSRISYR